jgi:nitric oxide reductase activation protein
MSYVEKPVYGIPVEVKLSRTVFVPADSEEEAKATLRTREGWAKATQHDDNDEVQGANPKRVEFFKPYLCEGVTAEVWVDEGSDDDDDQEAARTDR